MLENIGNNEEFRIMQVFMGHKGSIYETYAHLGTGALYCTCPGYEARKICKHTEYISNVQEEQGVFTMRHGSGEPEEILKAFETAAGFRLWMLENSEIAYI